MSETATASDAHTASEASTEPTSSSPAKAKPKAKSRARRRARKRWGLILDLPGAPETPHTIPGYPGYYRPDVPTPIGDEGELSYQQAKKASGEDGVHLKLVEIKPGDITEAERVAKQMVIDGRRGISAARRDDPQGAEKARIADEAEAVKEAS